MNIQQVSVLYADEQDRILLRINIGDGEELRLWLTRRLTLAVVPVLKERAAEQISKSGVVDAAAPVETQRQQLLDKFNHEAKAYAGDFKTPYKEPAAPSPVADMLVTDITLKNITIDSTHTEHLQLDLIEKLNGKSRDVKVTMSPALAQGLLQLLKLAIQKSGWLIVPPVTGQAEGDSNSDALMKTDRPVYLN